MSPPRVPVTLRALVNTDTDLLSTWYQDDREGLEEVFGARMPTEREYMRKCNELFALTQRFTARILMAELKGEPIGFVLVTDMPATLEMARAHIYLTPNKRRYAVRVGEAGMAEVEKMGIHMVFQNVLADNPSSIKLGKKLGFVPSPIMTMIKELR
jgi:RimJ/RimL family protein N-acetyltransferase